MLETRIATTAEEKEAVYRFRYSIYVEEMGRYLTTADHPARRLEDPEDEHSWIVYTAEEGEVLASLRMTWGGHGFSARQIQQYGLEPFLAELPASALAVGERTMIDPTRRGGASLLPALLEQTSSLTAAHGVSLVFGACEPHLLSLYVPMQKPYATRNINSPEAGYLVPLISVVGDPTATDGTPPPSVAAALEGSGAITSPALIGADRYLDILRSTLGRLDRSLFDGLTDAEVDLVCTRSHILACAEDDRVLKKGGAARNVFVVLSGALEVSDGGRPVGVLLPGDVFGETAYLLRQSRTFDVDVLNDDTQILSLSERMLRDLAETAPDVAAKLFTNLSVALCRRYATTV
jgi:hypothetical protein